MAPLSHPKPASPSIPELFTAFLIQGATSFGGPAAGLASLEAEFSRRREWIPHDRFRELLTWSKLLPGPVATQLGILIGRDLRGTAGGAVAGVAFISPAILLVLGLSAAGSALQGQTLAAGILSGLTASALAVVAVAVTDLGRTQIRNRGEFLAVWIAAVLSFLWPRIEPLLVIGAGLASAIRIRDSRPRDEKSARVDVPWHSILLAGGWGALLILSVLVPRRYDPSWIPMGLASFRAASLTFGTGMAVLPVLHSAFVDLGHWVGADAFTQAIALGQVTPGPIVTTASALGYSGAGWPGGLACTVGIFLPSFLNTLVFIPQIERRVRNRSHLEAFVRGAMPWIIGSIAAAGLKLGGPILLEEGWHRLAIFAFSLLLAALPFRGRRLPPWIVIPLGGALSALASLVRP